MLKLNDRKILRTDVMMNLKEKLSTALVVLVIFGIMFALNYLMPLHRDDYDYSMIWGTTQHVESISDVIESTYNHYLLHGGRLFTVFCLNFFLWLGKFSFDVANSILFTALVLLSSRNKIR